MKKKTENEILSEKMLCAEYEAVYRYTLALCKNETLAEDVTQDTFLKAMKAYEGFKGECSLYTWLCSIAKREFLNRIRKQSHENSMDESFDVPDEKSDSLENLIQKKDTAMYIHTLLHKMDEPYKEVFSLRVFGELSFSEIAKLFSKTESWARVTFHRARKIINEQLRKDGYFNE